MISTKLGRTMKTVAKAHMAGGRGSSNIQNFNKIKRIRWIILDGKLLHQERPTKPLTTCFQHNKLTLSILNLLRLNTSYKIFRNAITTWPTATLPYFDRLYRCRRL